MLDVKYGSGAFMKTVEDARNLAKAMVGVGNLMGRKMVALITDMNQPLGKCVGNVLEIEESIAVLKGEEKPEDLVEVCLALASEMLVMANVAPDVEGAKKILEEKLANGEAYRKFEEMVKQQGGTLEGLPKARAQTEVKALASGFITHVDTERVGWAAISMGTGRKIASDKIDHSVGFSNILKVGTQVKEGDVMAVIHHNQLDVTFVLNEITSAFVIGDKAPPAKAMVVDRVFE